MGRSLKSSQRHFTRTYLKGSPTVLPEFSKPLIADLHEARVILIKRVLCGIGRYLRLFTNNPFGDQVNR